MGRNILQVSIKDGDDELNILADFLRTGSVTLQSLEALKGYYSSLSVAKFPGSSREDRDKSLLKSLGLLKQQMCYLMDFHHQLDGTVVTPDSFSTVMINPVVKEYAEFDQFDALGGKPVISSGILPESETNPLISSPPAETTGQRLSRENQERSGEIDREIANRSNTQPNFVPDEDEDDQDFDEEYEKYKQTEDEDEDEDDDDNLTDEEYLEKMKSITRV